ncbi:restriction endonuclease subunit S [Vagococcus fluvialis]|uniref:restriction endonuclease subunit S n=1 Tax=Vagococcus fluvialis TaxID=2738 RepID=UPI00288D4998|nr:restriction endonuclease subunit S [Vagococcus fluvialis]MDT2782693.1 restriction endonuclease subunit S [Vagococcus fluvialis]
MKEKMIPEIRFKGFTDTWEQRKLGEVFYFPVSTNSLSRAQLNYTSGKIKSIHYGDILVNYSSILDVKNDTIPFITDGDLDKYKSNLLENGDLVFADAAEDETVGKAIEVNNLTDENLVAGLHTIVARAKSKKSVYYLGYYINSDNYHRQLLRLMQGTKVSSISKGNLQKTVLSYPKDLAEQTKIGNFFKQLDETITLQERKVNLLKEQKKGYLQKMFPKQNEKFPELRFEGFTDAWEQCKLKDITSYESSKYSSSQFDEIESNGNYPIFDANKEIIKTDKYDQENEYISIIKDGAGVGRTQIRPEKSSVIGTMGYIKPNNNDIYFIKSLLDKIDFSKYVSGSTIPHIYYKDYGNYKTMTPSIEEQIKIGNFIKSLDDTIALQERKLETLKELKKGYLQKMFA